MYRMDDEARTSESDHSSDERVAGQEGRLSTTEISRGPVRPPRNQRLRAGGPHMRPNRWRCRSGGRRRLVKRRDGVSRGLPALEALLVGAHVYVTEFA